MGTALDRGCEACLNTWPQQLHGFFGALRFANKPPATVEHAVHVIDKELDGERHRADEDPQTLLATVSQELRHLSAKQAQGAFFTPWTVAHAMATMLLTDSDQPQELWICDPAAGGGVLLIAALAVYRQRHGPLAARALTLVGVELDPRVAQIARASLLIAGADPNQFWIFAGDSLAQPVVGRDRSDGQLKRLDFHLILGNPPFGGKAKLTELEAHAQQGPLVIPDHVLYRHIPRVETAAPVTPPPAAPVTAPTAATSARPHDHGSPGVPAGEQLQLPFAA